MAQQIRMAPETMNKRAREYRTEADKVRDVTTAMNKILKGLETEWEGAAAKSYVTRVTKEKKNVENVEKLIREIAKSLDESAKIVKETDARIAKAYNGS